MTVPTEAESVISNLPRECRSAFRATVILCVCVPRLERPGTDDLLPHLGSPGSALGAAGRMSVCLASIRLYLASLGGSP